MTCREALEYVARILILTHEETREKKFELEMSWLTKENNYKHEMVPRELRDAAEARATARIEEEQQN